MTIGASPSLSAVRTELSRTGVIGMNDSSVRFLGQVSGAPSSVFAMSSLIGKASQNYAVFVGTDGGSYGYYAVAANHTGPFGNISDGSFRGNQISSVFTFGGDLFFRLYGNIASSAFNGMQFFFTGGFDGTPIAQFTSASATRQVITPGGVTETQWQWAGANFSPYIGQNIFLNLTYTP